MTEGFAESNFLAHQNKRQNAFIKFIKSKKYCLCFGQFEINYAHHQLYSEFIFKKLKLSETKYCV